MTYRRFRKAVQITWALASIAVTALQIKAIVEDQS